MAYSNVANSGKLTSSSGGALTWTHSTTANNLLTFRAGSFNSELSTTQVTSVGGAGTFTRDVGVSNSGDSLEWSEIYSLLSPSGVTSMTCASGGPSNRVGVFNEWSGNATTSILDTTNTAGGNATSGSVSLTCGANAGLVIASANADSNNTNAMTGTGTFTNDYDFQDSTDALVVGVSYLTGAVGGASQTASWTWPNASFWGMVIASYNLAPSGPYSPPPVFPGVFNLDARRMI